MAATASTNMPISATVGANCIVSAAPLDFGTYDPLVANATTPLDVSSTITVQCVKNTNYSVSLDLGLHATGGNRFMSDGGTGTLQYELYSDSGHGTIWNTTSPVTGTAADLSPIDIPVYGRVPEGQDVVATSYTDTVSVTVNF
jgi:spore coat protein U-like protein